MNKFLRKTGSILFCLLPVLLAFGIQLLVSISAIILKIISLIFQNPQITSDINQYMTTVLNSMDGVFLASVSAIYAVLAGLVMGFWYWRKFAPKHQPRRSLTEIINLKMFGGLLALMLGMQYLSSYIVNLLYVINPDWYESYVSLIESIGFENVSWVLAVYSIIIAPISEELIFRGVTMGYARKAMPFWLANIFQAFLFGLFHGNIVQGTYAFVVGLFCGYVCYRGGSIYLSILFHMLFNLWGTFPPEMLYYSGNATFIHILIFLLSAALSLLGFYLYNCGADQRNTQQE